ncbi:MAG: M24 family metallopeptidase [Solirubrobacteraceae bacterium]
MNEASRAERLAEALEDAGVELMLVTELTNIRYLTGFTGSSAVALIGSQTRLFATDFRYVEQSAAEVDPSFERRTCTGDLVEGIAKLLPEGDLRLGFESEHTSVARHRRLGELLGERVEPVGVAGLVERLRCVKDEHELHLIAEAARLSEEAFEELLAGGLRGRTERELALALEYGMRSRGAEGVSFPPIIAAGPNGALPHAKPRDVAVGDGDLVVIDWGALLGGYCSDCTRTVAVGDVGEEAREAYALVLRAQRKGLDAVRAGDDGRAIDRLVRDVIDGAGHSEHYGHGLGHGVGLEIHEAPTLSFRASDTLAAGNVVTVEPGVYLPRRFGVRIEDLVAVGQDGVRVLTSLPKELRVVA